MPYSGPNDAKLPEHVKGMPEARRKQWVEVFNQTMADCEGDGCEGKAMRMANGVVKKAMAGNLQMIAANLAGQVRRISHDGREYLVSPAIAIKAPAVLNGEFVPAEEVSRFVEAWNGIILPIGHPQDMAGNFINANTPELEAKSLGRFWNAAFRENRLHGELWVDIERAHRLGGEALTVLERLEAGEPLELSTAYFRDVEPVSGEYDGQRYNGIARNLRPNHLALLPNETGACSWQDGCGSPRVNQEGGMQVNEMDFSESVIIAFYPSADDAQALALQPGALPAGSEVMQPGELHLTLAHLGKIEEIDFSEAAVMKALARWVSDMPIVRVEVGGLIRFNRSRPRSSAPPAPQRGEGEGGLQAVAAVIDSPYLGDFQRSLCYWMEDSFPISRKYGFIPHITLGYVPEGEMANVPVPERREIVFEAVAVSWGMRTTLFRLQGEAREMAMQGNKAGGIKGFFVSLARKFGFSLDKEGDVSKKTDLIAALVANQRCKFGQATLEKLDEAELQTLTEQLAAPPAQPSPPDPPEGGVGGGSQAAPAQPVANAQGGEEPPAWAKQLIQEVAELKTGFKANADQEKAQLVEMLVANQVGLPKSGLEKMSVEELRQMRQVFVPVDFSGRGLPAVNQGGGEWEEYQVPEVVMPGQNGPSAGSGGK